ncbi:NAD-dependent succinate-semialdehyde dehydrogenase [Emcibacter sp.]|uniref:NAD-dependent succinate-semialdehyde dehydrogenase n=1 Tax=Emcibacter sp. TaxID=1979954 RepID=UPI003A8CCB30
MSNAEIIQQVLQSAAAQGNSNRNFDVFNPATGELVATVADMDGADTLAAIEAAKKALPVWSGMTAKERGKILMAWHDLILEYQEELARLLTLEMGKPLAEARGEILYGASFIEWFAEEGKRVYGDIIPSNGDGRRLFVLKQPIGVVAAITPWNFPNAMITRKVAPALAAGCTTVTKPAEDTPLSALALQMLAQKAGFPDGVMNLVTTRDAVPVAEVLTKHPDVRKLSFTGSTRVGKILMGQCAETVKKVSLELGGNAPFIIFDDADLDAAVEAVIATKFRNGGQTCVSLNRLLVSRSVMEEFGNKLKDAVAKLTVGDGLKTSCPIGPLINQAAIDKVSSLVADARDKGANVVLGGDHHELGGNFYQPTILSGISDEMEIATSEIFGPVIAIYPFDNEGEAIRMANDTPYGLASYFFAGNVDRIFRVAESLEYGMVAINGPLVSSEATPFGGVKESGVGREGSKYGLDDFIVIKYLCMSDLSRRK